MAAHGHGSTSMAGNFSAMAGCALRGQFVRPGHHPAVVQLLAQRAAMVGGRCYGHSVLLLWMALRQQYGCTDRQGTVFLGTRICLLLHIGADLAAFPAVPARALRERPLALRIRFTV